MNHGTTIFVTALISCLATLFFVSNKASPAASFFPRPSRIVHETSKAAPNFGPPKMTRSRSYMQGHVRTEGADCSSDYNICGEGFYCCSGTCYKAVEVTLMFAADDRGDLYVCQQNGYNSVASTDNYQATGQYKGWLPCTDTYLKVTNTNLEGGATILMYNDVLYGASGTSTLPIESEPDWSHVFKPVKDFEALGSVSPYRDFASYWGAYPVTDSVNSSAGTMNLKFTPPGC